MVNRTQLPRVISNHHHVILIISVDDLPFFGRSIELAFDVKHLFKFAEKLFVATKLCQIHSPSNSHALHVNLYQVNFNNIYEPKHVELCLGDIECLKYKSNFFYHKKLKSTLVQLRICRLCNTEDPRHDLSGSLPPVGLLDWLIFEG